MSAKWPAMTHPKGSRLDNEKSHGHTDPNSGGGPAAPVKRNFKPIPPAQRGGFGQKQPSPRPQIHGGRSGSGNPADRGSITPVGRQSFPSEVRNPNAGGGVQERRNITQPANQGGFGHFGQKDVPTEATSHGPGAGNIAGRMHRRIAGHFDNRSKGNRSGTGIKGSYGDRKPID